MKPVKKVRRRLPRYPSMAKAAKLIIRVTDVTRETWDGYVEALGIPKALAIRILAEAPACGPLLEIECERPRSRRTWPKWRYVRLVVPPTAWERLLADKIEIGDEK